MAQKFVVEIDIPDEVGPITADEFKEHLENHDDLGCTYNVTEIE